MEKEQLQQLIDNNKDDLFQKFRMRYQMNLLQILSGMDTICG